MLLPMTKIQILGTKGKLEPTLRALHRLGTVQIEDMAQRSLETVLPKMALDAVGLKQLEEVALLVTRLEALLALLPLPSLPENLPRLYEDASVRPTEELLTEVKKVLNEIAPKAQALALRRDELNGEQASLSRYQATIRTLMPLAAELPELAGFETVALLIERRSSAVLNLIRQELLAWMGEQFELNARHVDEETTAAILVFPKEQSERVNSLLGRENISQVRLPKELAGVSFKDAVGIIAVRLVEIPREMEQIRAELRELAKNWSGSLALLRAVARDRLQEMEIVGHIGTTRYAFVLVGWLPSKSLSAVKDALRKAVGEQVVVSELEVDREEMKRAPVALSNPAPVRPFEFLVRLVALPRYGALDPTPLLALFMPVFFGLILGDVAYGAVLLIIAALLWRRFSSGALRSLAQVMVLCGFWAVVFGFVFGEFLGSLGHQIFGLRPLWMERSGVTLIPLLVFAVAIGAAHVTLGLILGVWEAARRRSRRELSERLGRFVALVALFWLLGVLSRQLPQGFSTPGVAALIIGIVLLGMPMGWMGGILGPLEALGMLGNVLSYLRLAAIGLASFYLAEVANRLYGMSANVALGAIVAGLLHALNLTLGIVSSTIQSLRLHYVEFFTKFYESGGESFKPFKQSGI